MITIAMDWPTAVAVLASVVMVVGGLVEVFRCWWSRDWWHDFDKRISVLESRLGDMGQRGPGE